MLLDMNRFVRFLNEIIAHFGLAERSARSGRTPVRGDAVTAPAGNVAGVFGAALRLLALLTLLTGLLYPLALTAVAHLLFPDQAAGSLAVVDGQVVGSLLIGQPATDPRYFWPRPSAVGYMAGAAPALTASGATNFGPTHAALAAEVAARARAFRAAHGLADSTAVPPDMLFASGSGLDPHISPAAARCRSPRGRRARARRGQPWPRWSKSTLRARNWGILGQPRLNVLLLNLALDGLE
jgi:K+-transporting ATPase ATPase C chain